MSAYLNHFAFEFKTGLRNPSQSFLNYLFPLAFYAMMGLVMTQINPGFKAVLIPAMIVFAAMCGTILGLPSPLVEAREAGIFRSFKINGVPAASILVIPMQSAMIHGLLVCAVIAVTGGPLFGGTEPQNWLYLALLTLATTFTFGAIGTLIGVVSANARATIFYSQGIFLPSMLLGGLMVPLDMLPKSIQPVSALLPTAHAMQALLGAAYGVQTVFNPLTATIVLLSSGVLALGLAVYLFNWDSRNQSRRGHPLMALIALAPYVVFAVAQAMS